MPLDPIVSLTIAIAESPGSYAFLLGSGVSRDAGVPTGMEVFWQTETLSKRASHSRTDPRAAGLIRPRDTSPLPTSTVAYVICLR